ncbi:unnamed protein product [Orchesella dallaii]|uniref:Uncharacterized protein n=1 Tax=Orchesella dallaii TaxID=48710 RepID=A0ABP1PJT8_9HEXA
MNLYYRRIGRILSFLFLIPAEILSSPSNRPFSGIDRSKLQFNEQPEIVHRNERNEKLTIFELVMLGQLQNFVEDEMGIERFTDPFWVGTSFLTNLLETSRWNVKSAKRKFRKAIRQRRASASNALANEVPLDLFRSFDFEIKGLDKESCPIITLPVGQWRTYRSYVEKIKSLQVAQRLLPIYFHNVMERVLERLRNRNDSECSQLTLIADMDGYNFVHSSGQSNFKMSFQMFLLFVCNM